MSPEGKRSSGTTSRPTPLTSGRGSAARRRTSHHLPPGPWTDYQTGKTYEGTRWHRIRAGEIPIVTLIRDGAAIPHIRLAQSTDRMDWGAIELAVYSTGPSAEGLFCLPEDGTLHLLRLEREGDDFVLEEDPLEGEVEWNVRAVVTDRRRDV